MPSGYSTYLGGSGANDHAYAVSVDDGGSARKIGIDGIVVAFTAGISIVTGLLFAVLPALRTEAPRLTRMLGGSGRGGPMGRERQWAARCSWSRKWLWR